MTSLLESPTAIDELEAQLLFKEARRRRRRLRVIWITVVTALSFCLAGVGYALHDLSTVPARTPPADARPRLLPHAAPAATLVYAFDDLRFINADTGATRVLPLPAPYGPSRDLGMVRVGDGLLLNRGNTAWLYRPGFAGAPVDLGRSDGVLPGPTGTEAWIWSQPCRDPYGCTNYSAPQMGSVQLIDGDGSRLGAPVSLPGGSGWYPTGLAGASGIVLAEQPSYGSAEEVWDPSTDQVVQLFPDASVIGMSGDVVIWEPAQYCTSGCSFVATDTKTGSRRTVQLPAGTVATGDAGISPDGSTVAITVALEKVSRSPYPQAIALIRIGSPTRTASILPGSAQMTDPSLGSMNFSWADTGQLFWFTVGTKSVYSWSPGEGRAHMLPAVKLPHVTLVNEDPALFAL